MQSNRLALVAPLSVILAAAGATNFACSNSDDDNNNAKADSGVYIDGGIQEGVPPGSGYTPPAGGDDDDDDDSGTTPGSEAGTTPPTDGGGGDTGTTPPTDAGDAGDSGGGTTLPTTLAVLRLGDGMTALPTSSETTTAAFIDFYKVSGGAATGTPVSLGSGFSVIFAQLGGGLALSTNGHYLAVGGFNVAAGTANAAGLVRSIARVSAAGAVDTSTISGAFTGSGTSYIRDVASVDGTAFWVTGTGSPDGTYYIPFGDTGTGGVQLESSPATTRDVGIFAGQLYISAATTTTPTFTGVGPVGTAAPKTTGQTATVAITDATNPEGFVAFDTDTTAGVDLAYVADGTNGVLKFKLSGTTWSEVGSAITIGAGGARAITGFVNAGAVSLFATSDDGTVIAAIADTLTSTTNGTATTLVTAGTKTSLRGIAFAAQ